MSSNRYMQRGVSAAKEDVHKAISKLDKGLFPQAFCKISPDIFVDFGGHKGAGGFSVLQENIHTLEGLYAEFIRRKEKLRTLQV